MENALRIGVDGERYPVNCSFILLPGSAITIDEHRTDWYAVHYFLQGDGRYSDETGTDVPIRPGSVLQRIPGLQHSFGFPPASEVALASLRFPAAAFEFLKQLGVSGNVHQSIPLDPVIVQRFEHFLARSRDCPWNELPRITLEMMEFAIELLRLPQHENSFLDKAKRLLAEQPEQRVDMPIIAARLNMSYSAFRQRFRREAGLSPNAHRIECRLRRAQELLVDGRYSISEVAQMLGYPDYFSFAKQFKKTLGQSPRTFIDIHTAVSITGGASRPAGQRW